MFLLTQYLQACRTTPLAVCLVAVEDDHSLDGQCGEGRAAGVCRHLPASGQMPVIQPDHPSCQSLPHPAASASTSL